MPAGLTHSSAPAAIVVAALLVGLALAAAARGEVVQEGGVRISLDATLRPATLPREGTVPATVTIGARFTPLDAALPPRLRQVTIAINRRGYLDSSGLPICRYRDLQASTTEAAVRRCGRSLVGEGRFRARILIPGQAPFPSRGRLLSFYGRFRGRPAILAHVYGRNPIPTSHTIPFLLKRNRGTFGTVLSASLEPALGESGYITLLRMTLGGRFGHLRAGCPAPAGVSSALFPLASLSIGFPQRRLRTALLRSCRVG